MKSTERFSGRAADYVKYRPHYPSAAFAELQAQLGLGQGTVVADVGSGTGIATKPLLDLGCTVYAVEPNADMRRAAEDRLRTMPQFHSVVGTAEATTLPDDSVDAVLAAQAFHWFDAPAARREFARILKRGGWVVLLENDRLDQGSPFMADYRRLIEEFATDSGPPKSTGQRLIDPDRLADFFGAAGHRYRSFPIIRISILRGSRGGCGRRPTPPAKSTRTTLP